MTGPVGPQKSPEDAVNDYRNKVAFIGRVFHPSSSPKIPFSIASPRHTLRFDPLHPSNPHTRFLSMNHIKNYDSLKFALDSGVSHIYFLEPFINLILTDSIYSKSS
jgi:hypothetical protein